jgi:tetratricopeptide (TPR) repeat protein/tRNA A-37 threonylcarbamoyl transferase component Bud32
MQVVPAGDEVPPNLFGYDNPTRLDEGGMGVVWRIYDRQFKVLLAVKVMKAEKSVDQHWVDRFFAEVRITAQLAHPSIVPVHALGRLADGRPYYVMKLVKGQRMDLLGRDLLKGGSDVTSKRSALLQVFFRVCQALAFAHSKAVVHCDVKPRNVMVGEHGEVQVMDWGEAKLLTESDDRSHAVTWAYASPEQANSQIEHLDRRSDVFGLGAMLCEILTGRPPYDGPTEADVIRQAKDADLAGAHERLERCGADPELIDLTRACLSREPNDRPPDASAVEERLTGYLASVQERLEQAKVAEAEARARAEQEEQTRRLAEQKAEAERQARRRTQWFAASAGLFLVALVAAGYFFWQNSEARQKILADTLDRALTAAMSGDLDTADQATAEAEQTGASAGQVHMLRGQIALHRGQSREAREHLEKAVQVLPKSVAAWGMLAAAHAEDGHWERYDKALQELERRTPATPEDFLFRGYAEAYLEPERGLETIKKAFDRRPMMSIALLVRAEVRAMLAQDTDNLDEAEGAVQDAKYARELLHDNPTALWVSLQAHLAKASVHEHRNELEQRRAELELAGKDADALKRFTALPEAVVYRWTYLREVGREEEVLDELRRASQETDHVSVNFSCTLALYRRAQRGDLEEALRLLERRPGTYNDRLLPFVLAEHDYQDRAKYRWPARAVKASEDYAKTAKDGAAVMDTLGVLRMLGQKEEAVKACEALLDRPELFYTLRREPILQCLRYNAGKMTADELVKLAGSSRWNQCLAHYHIAMTKLSEGDRKAAKEHFEKAVKTRAWGWGEYDLSWVFLSRLEKDPNWPAWIPTKR